jgi:hypothetical protein
LSPSAPSSGAREFPRKLSGDPRARIAPESAHAAPPRFARPVGFTVGSGYGSITTADRNRDGVSDILLGNESRRGFSVFLGKGDGPLGSSIDTSGPAGSAAIPFVLAADFNRDGRPDLAGVAANGRGGTLLINPSGVRP